MGISKRRNWLFYWWWNLKIKKEWESIEEEGTKEIWGLQAFIHRCNNTFVSFERFSITTTKFFREKLHPSPIKAYSQIFVRY